MLIYLDKEAGRIYIVMEYCEGGDLSKIMETQKEERFFEEKQVSFLCRHSWFSMIWPKKYNPCGDIIQHTC